MVDEKFDVKKYYGQLTKLFKQGPVMRHRVATKVKGPGEQGTPIGTARAFLRHVNNAYASTIASYGQYNRLARYCVHFTTKIYTIEWGFISIGELAEKHANEKFHVYSYDLENKKVVIAEAKNPRKTKTDKTIKLTFDDGSTLICTPDHRLLMRNGVYKEAQDVTISESIMPLYRREIFKNKYKFLITAGQSAGFPEHRLVCEWKEKRKQKENEVVHHIDRDPTNNKPENLMFMDKHEHYKMHGKEGAKMWEEHHDEIVQKLKDSWRENYEYRCAVNKKAWENNEERRKNASEKTKAFNETYWTDENRAKHSKILKEAYSSEERRKMQSERAKLSNKTNADYWLKHSREKPEPVRDDPTFEELIEATIKVNFNRKATAEQIDRPIFIVDKLIHQNGFKRWCDFRSHVKQFNNHKLIKVEDYGINDVYDLEVPIYHNFAIGDWSKTENGREMAPTMFIHNSDYNEMESMAEINSALDIYSDETTAKGEDGELLKIDSPNPEIRKSLNFLFYDVLNIEFNAWNWIRNLCKYGDQFLLVDHHPDYGVLNVLPMPVNEVEREEGYDETNPMAYRYRWVTQGNRVLENWQVIHFRLLGSDNFMPYGSCLPQLTTVDYVDGRKVPIKDVRQGDKVYSYDASKNALVPATILAKKSNGVKPVFEVRTRHRSLIATDNHPFLLASGEYKQVKDLTLGDKLVLPNLANKHEGCDIRLPDVENSGDKRIKNISLPKYVDKKFAELFGFLLGDGWFSQGTHQKGRYSGHFATGVREGRNENYKAILEQYSLTPKYRSAGYRKNAAVEFNSKRFREVFEKMGWIDGAHNKRIPQWVFQARKDIQKAFLKGLMDADGSAFVDKWDCKRNTIELCNKQLVEDVKQLVDLLGCKSGKIVERQRTGNTLKNGQRIKPNSKMYALNFYNTKLFGSEEFAVEKIESIEPKGEDEVWDVQVDNDLHNFVAQGLVVHNSILEAARRVWRQLILMEDAVMVYRIVRCVHKDSRIWTNSGHKKIKNIKAGDKVYSYNKVDDKLVLSTVTDCINNGSQQIWKIKSKHRTLKTNFNHPILVKDKKTGMVDYVQVHELEPKRFQLVLPKSEDFCESKETDIFEDIYSIEKTQEYEDVYDIRVDNDLHNFIADGCVVHNSPERRVFYIDVGNVAPKDIPQFIEKAQTQLKRNQILDSDTGRVDLRYNALCVRQSTTIPLQDGRTLTLKQLIDEWKSGKQDQWAYSVDTKENKLVPGKIVWAGMTRKNAQLVRVHIDDGSYIDVTPDHKFMLRNKEYRQAQELNKGDALMPLYKRLSSKNDGMRIEGYQMSYDPFKGKYVFDHRINANRVLSEQREQVRRETDWELNNNLTVHHKDFNKLNNTPDNLLWIGNRDHFVKHGEQGRKNIIKYNKSPEKRARTSFLNKERNSVKNMAWYNGSELHKSHNENRKQGQLKSWGENKEGRSKAMRWTIPDECIELGKQLYRNDSKLNRDRFIKAFKNDEKILQLLQEANRDFNRPISKLSRVAIERKLNELGYNGFSDYKKDALKDFVYMNHKVAKVEWLSEREDTGCITVEKYHNFATGGDISSHSKVNINLPSERENAVSACFYYIKNSSDEDYFIPVRGPDGGSRIDTLPGGQFTGDIEDLQYIQSKLFAALKIPKSYLGYEADISSKSTLCIQGTTKIPLLDGRTLTLSEIINEYESNKDKPLYTYSVDTNSKKVIPGKISWAGITKKDASLVRLWFDNDKYLDCTENHEIVMRDGVKKQAHELKVGDSLMPLYRRLGTRNYEEVYHPGEDRWEYTHKAVTVSDGKYIQGKVIHHIDANKYNNNPENFDCTMTWLEHRRYHQKHVEQTLRRPDVIEQRNRDFNDPNSKWSKWIHSDEHREISSEHMKKQTSPGGSLYEWIHGDEIKKSMSNTMKARWRNPDYRKLKIQQNKDRWLDPEFRSKHSGKNHWISKKYEKYDFKWLIDFCKNNEILAKKDFLKKAPIGPRYLDKLLKKNLNGKLWRTFKKEYLDCTTNHKLVKIEYLDEKADVGCLTIDNEFHNFAIDSGIIVGNSQEDTRFARTIQRIQQVFIAELNKLAVIHLFSMGFNGSDMTNFKISMANPSSIAELQRLEVWRTRFEVASVAREDMFDRNFIYKRLWKLNDDDIEQIEEGKRKDRMFDLEIENMQAPGAEQGALPPGEEGAAGALPGGEEGGQEAMPAAGSSEPTTPGMPPPPGPETPITAGKDPNIQAAGPNELIRPLKKRKKKKLTPDLHKYVFGTEKTAMDPKRSYSELTRMVRAPFGESARKEADERAEQRAFDKNAMTLRRFAEDLENAEGFLRSSGNKKEKKILKS